MTSRPTYSNPGGKKDTKDTSDRTIKMESLLSIEDCIGPGKTAFCLWDDEFKNDYLDKKIKYEKHVYDQGEDIGSCAANAVAAAYRYALQRQGLPDFLPSRLFLYWVARMSDDENWVNLEPTESNPNPVSPQSLVPPQWGVEDDGWGIFYEGFAKSPPRLVNLLRKDAGSEPRDVIQCMARLGAPAETSRLYGWAPGTFPYPFGDLGDPSSGDGQGEKEHYSQEVKHQIAIWSKGSNKAELFPETSLAAVRPDDSTFVLAQRPFDLQYARPPEEDYKAWKKCIANGIPIVFHVELYPSWGDSVGYYPFIAATPPRDLPRGTDGSKKQEVGGHVALAIGWDDTMKDGEGCFKIQDSYGPWVDDGTGPTGESTKGQLNEGYFWLPYAWLTTDSPWNSKSKLATGPWALTHQKEHTQAP